MGAIYKLVGAVKRVGSPWTRRPSSGRTVTLNEMNDPLVDDPHDQKALTRRPSPACGLDCRALQFFDCRRAACAQ